VNEHSQRQLITPLASRLIDIQCRHNDRLGPIGSVLDILGSGALLSCLLQIGPTLVCNGYGAAGQLVDCGRQFSFQQFDAANKSGDPARQL